MRADPLEDDGVRTRDPRVEQLRIGFLASPDQVLARFEEKLLTPGIAR